MKFIKYFDIKLGAQGLRTQSYTHMTSRNQMLPVASFTPACLRRAEKARPAAGAHRPHVVKLSPQPQVPFAWGFSKMNSDLGTQGRASDKASELRTRAKGCMHNAPQPLT